MYHRRSGLLQTQGIESSGRARRAGAEQATTAPSADTPKPSKAPASPRAAAAAERLFAEPIAGEGAATRFFEAQFADADPRIETLFVAHVDAQSRCIHLSRHAGNEAAAELPLRDIVIDAARLNSKGVVLAHNHPSGDCTPSSSDRQATRRLAATMDAMGVTLLDHLVFGGGACTSFRRVGLL
jgi:DNA repair protein RadC